MELEHSTQSGEEVEFGTLRIIIAMLLRYEHALRSEHAPRNRRFAVVFSQLLEVEDRQEQLLCVGITPHPCCIIHTKTQGSPA